MASVSKPSFQEIRAYVYWKSVDKEKEGFEKKWAPVIYKVLQFAGNRIAAALERGEGAEHITSDSYLQGWIIQPMSEVYKDMFYDVELHFGRSALSQFIGKSVAVITATKGTKAEDDDWTEWDPYSSPEMQAWNKKVTGVNIVGVADSVRRRVRKMTAEALAEGKDNAEIARLIRSSYGFSWDRATRIAQTEINSAQNAGQHFAMSKFMDPKNVVKTWLATRDRRTRATHAAAHGQDKQLDDPFTVGSSKLQFPGDISMGASAREVIRCRCTCTYAAGGQVTAPGRVSVPGPKTGAIPDPGKVPNIDIPFEGDKGSLPYKWLQKSFEKAPPELVKALKNVQKLGSLEFNASGKNDYGAFYSWFNGKYIAYSPLNLAPKEFAFRGRSALSHEFGHHMDYFSLPASRGGKMNQVIYASRKQGGLSDGIHETHTALAKLKEKDPKAYQVIKDRMKALAKSTNYDDVSVADIMGSITGGELGGGHSKDYYLNKGSVEVLSNLVSLHAVGRMDLINELRTVAPSLVDDYFAFIKNLGAGKFGGKGSND